MSDEKEFTHYSVLLNESIEYLNIKENGIYVDATLGLGGHSSKILSSLKTGHLYSFDEDINAINNSKKRLENISKNFTLIKSNFVNMKQKLQELGIEKVDGIIFDLGVSSPQIDDATRGFSFMNDGPLDMRMDTESSKNAFNIVNTYKEEQLTNIFFSYGEEKLSKTIAKKIINKRPINTTLQLTETIKEATGSNYFYKNHPERKIFQAIRIEVNDELKVLETVLPDAIDLLNAGGRICVITFHSLEDRIVKQTFKKYSEVEEIYKGLPDIPKEYLPKLKIVNKKPILPSKKELEENTRSLSAKLRVVERIYYE